MECWTVVCITKVIENTIHKVKKPNLSELCTDSRNTEMEKCWLIHIQYSCATCTIFTWSLSLYRTICSYNRKNDSMAIVKWSIKSIVSKQLAEGILSRFCFHVYFDMACFFNYTTIYTINENTVLNLSKRAINFKDLTENL